MKHIVKITFTVPPSGRGIQWYVLAESIEAGVKIVHQKIYKNTSPNPPIVLAAEMLIDPNGSPISVIESTSAVQDQGGYKLASVDGKSELQLEPADPEVARIAKNDFGMDLKGE